MLRLDDLPLDQFLIFLGKSRLILRGDSYSRAIRQHRSSRCWGVHSPRDGGELVAVGGVRPVAPEAGEVWSVIASHATPRPLIRLTRDVLVRFAPIYPGGLYSFCVVGSKGEKLNRLCGFVPTDEVVADYRIWRFSP